MGNSEGGVKIEFRRMGGDATGDWAGVVRDGAREPVADVVRGAHRLA